MNSQKKYRRFAIDFNKLSDLLQNSMTNSAIISKICEEGSRTEIWWQGRIGCFLDSGTFDSALVSGNESYAIVKKPKLNLPDVIRTRQTEIRLLLLQGMVLKLLQ